MKRNPKRKHLVLDVDTIRFLTSNDVSLVVGASGGNCGGDGSKDHKNSGCINCAPQ
jgi:hypothetical protein